MKPKQRWLRLLVTYFLFCMLMTYFIILIIYGYVLKLFCNTEKGKMRYHRQIRRSFHFFFFHCIPGTKSTLRNPSRETFKQPALIIANHQSLLDLPGTLMLNNKIVAMCGQWVWDSKIYGRAIRFADFFPSSLQMDDMIAHIRSCMDRGYSVLVFPEGTRSEDQEVHTFRRGAFYIAEQLKCDVVPVTICGTGKCLPKTDFCYTPTDMLIEIGQRVHYADGVMGTTHSEMTRYWHKWFVQHYAELDAEMQKR